MAADNIPLAISATHSRGEVSRGRQRNASAAEPHL